MMGNDEDSSISGDESSDSKSSNNYDEDGSGNGSYELKNMEQDNQFKENPTSSINVIWIKFDYKEDTATEHQKKLDKIDLVRYHVLKEEAHTSTEIIHGSDRQFYSFVNLGKKGQMHIHHASGCTWITMKS